MMCIRLPLAFLLSTAAVSTSQAAIFVVDTTTDAVDAAAGDGTCATTAATCSLRAAVQEANALAGADTIELPAGTYVLTLGGLPRMPRPAATSTRGTPSPSTVRAPAARSSTATTRAV
jgi:CSLREA domain-containing protein